jgi:acetyl-CoA carboxylase carboxyl transferase beta subunit
MTRRPTPTVPRRHSPGARELVERVLDPGTWRSWDEDVAGLERLDLGPPPVAGRPGYAEELADARRRTGLDESVITGEGRLGGRRVAVIVCEFGFLAGSIGVAAAERFVRAVERATRERLPLVASPTSGGTRMQEGTVAFLQMVKISASIARHRAQGLPYVAYLRHPTTGGVLASFGSLAHVTAAEPGALIGFLGPRVYEALYGEPFPTGVQVAENLHTHGLIDAVVSPEDLRDIAVQAFDILCAPARLGPGGPAGPGEDAVPEPSPAPGGTRAAPVEAGHSAHPPGGPFTSSAPGTAWESVERSRRVERPSVRALLRVAARSVVPLNGTGQGEADPGLLLALARFGDAPCVVLGQDRRRSATSPLGPGGLRAARRGMRLAEEIGLPLVSVIDTAGAALSRQAEEGGLAGEIARSLADLTTLSAPTVCLLLGQGTGGGALALLPADRVVAAEHAWLSPLPPEGASAILHRTTDRAPEVAGWQQVRSADLLRHGIVDRIVPELPDAAQEPEPFLHRVGAVLAEELLGLLALDPRERLDARLLRYRRLGLPAD